jgi:signal transduction histidine kinase/CheY-like chemotaxis protein
VRATGPEVAVKRVVNFLVSPLRLISRSIALLAAALLLIGGWGLTAFFQTAQVARDAVGSLTVSASAVAASVDVPIEQFADMSDAFRAGDLQTPDRVVLTTRLLRLQGALPPVGATFAVSATGQLLAASSPYTAADASVADTDWFRHAVADNAMPVAMQRADSWLRPGPAAVLTRVVRDASGKVAGVVGAVLRDEDIARLIGRNWLGPGVSIDIRGADGKSILPIERAAAQPVGLTGQDDWVLGMQVMSAANRLLGIPEQLAVAEPLRLVDVTINARMQTDVAMKSHWLGTRALGILGAYLFAVWITCIALAVSARSNSTPGEPVPTGFGADWQADLDKRGCVIATHGNAPDRLREGNGYPLLAALRTAQTDTVAVTIAEALNGRSRRDGIEVVIASDDGQERIHRLSIEPQPDGRFLCIGRDVTSEMRLSARLDSVTAASQAAQDEAAIVAQDRDRVLAALGHDVRTPMNSIMGICSLLLDSELEQEQRIWLERIRASCEALLAMLNGLLEIASGDIGGLQVDEADVIGLVQEVADTLHPQARDKGLELKTRYDDLLRGYWRTDPTRLRQVLFNLVGNAIKFTPNGHVEIRASAAMDDTGATSVRLAVSDTGPGIALDDRARIFERFKRGREHEHSGHTGLGLGLALCRENAVLMGGALTVESALGVGSEFTFEFPAERVSQTTRGQRLAGRTALLVGDEDAKSRTVANLLGDTGVTVETAPDGYLGLAMAERIEAQRGALDLVVVQGKLAGMLPEVFVLRLRGTSFGRRAVVIWVGEGGETAKVDATVAAPADPYQVATLGQQLLTQRSPFEVLEPMVHAARGGRILVVEDDKVNQSLLVAALSRRGFSSFVANDGDEAVRLASRDTFDAILMDIQMPERDGFDATRRIRSLSGRVATIPIIALTGLKGPVVRKRCMEAGFTAVLEKPINLDRLGSTLRRWLPGGASAQAPRTWVGDDTEGTTSQDYAADVSQVFLEEMVAVVGMDRARACVADFVADASARCMRLGELLPGWEADAIVRSCEEISGLAETCGAIGLGEVLEEIADAVTRNDRSRAEALMERLERVASRLGPAMAACLDDIERRWGNRANKAA